MDWRPISFLFNRLLIHELESDLVILHRLPDLIEPEAPGPVLPDYDVHIGRFDVRQVRIGERVTGRERIGSLSGEAEIRSGRALIGLNALVRDGGDRLRLRIDSEPDRDRFDIDARVRAPANSVVGAMLGTRRPVSLDIGGDGGWTRWNGTARLDISGRRTAELAIVMNRGRFRTTGWAAPSPFLRGKLQRLTAGRVLVAGTGTFFDRRLAGRLSLRSAALRVESRGAVDLGRGRYDDVAIAAELLRPGRSVPQHDRPPGSADRPDRRPLRPRRFRLPDHRAARRLRRHRLRGLGSALVPNSQPDCPLGIQAVVASASIHPSQPGRWALSWPGNRPCEILCGGVNTSLRSNTARSERASERSAQS